MAAAQALTFFLFILNIVSFSLPFMGQMHPFFLLMAVYYWAVYRPTLMPPWIVFAYSVVLDVLSGLPPGTNAFVLIAVQWVVKDQRLFLMGQPFVMVWIGFAITAAVTSFLQWAIIALFQGETIPIGEAMASTGLSILLFPIVTLLLLLAHRMLPVFGGAYR